MAGRIQKESLITFGGLLLYVGSIMLKTKYGFSNSAIVWCFFAAYLLSGYSAFENVAQSISKKIFLEANFLMVIATVGLFGIGRYVEAVFVMLIFQIGNLTELFVNGRMLKKTRKLTGIEEIGEGPVAKTERKSIMWIRIYVLFLLLIAVAIVIVPRFFVKNYMYDKGLEKSFIFLIAACPCALGMSASNAFHRGMLSAAKRGIIVKSGHYLEALAKANVFMFDKTGTLTEGSFEVREVHAIGRTEEELLEIATYVESESSHPIAKALKNAYGKELDESRIEDVEELPGYGLSAMYEGKKVHLGNARLMKESAITFQEIYRAGSVIYVAVAGKYAGYILVSDRIRRDAKEMLKYLKQKCHAVVGMVTGDAQFSGKAVAQILELDYYYANQIPEEKAKRVEEFLEMQDETEYLAAVGNGIKDAEMLEKADIGIAIGANGSDDAIEVADIAVLEDDIMALVDAIRIAKEAIKVIRHNRILAIFVKIILIIMTVIGILSIKKVIVLEVCVMLIMILNASWASKDPS